MFDEAQFKERLEAAKQSTKALAVATTAQKNAALARIAEVLEQSIPAITRANADDLARGERDGLATGLLDRLKLDEARVRALAAAVRDVIGLADPVGQIVRGSTLANGIRISQVRVPFGVVGAIYEARPNVTIDIAALALKSGNAVLLRGGSAAEATNNVLVGLLQRAIEESGLPAAAVQTIDDFGRAGAEALMRARGYVDVLVPRGSAGLIRAVVEQSTVPVIETGAGIVHVYVDAAADPEMAEHIVDNAKTHRPSVCNAAETLLIHAGVAGELLPRIAAVLQERGVTLYGCERARAIFPMEAATEETWETEHLSLEMGVRVVDDLDAALAHIDRYSTHHTESIVTRDYAAAERFLAEVDSAAVMVNASTRFTDGGEFGFGAEVGISTQKLHARGPMGLPELTSTKWLVRGDGQVR